MNCVGPAMRSHKWLKNKRIRLQSIKTTTFIKNIEQISNKLTIMNLSKLRFFCTVF